MTIAYGLTEASPVITQTTTDDPIELRVTTVGKVLPHTETKIVNPLDGRTVPVGEHGELCTRGYHVMKGYYNNAAGDRKRHRCDGWLHTGDLAVMDENGYFKITGRAKDVIIRGGENISPREIEEFLYTCPGISAVQVIGVPDRKYGEQVAAWIKLERVDPHRGCDSPILRGQDRALQDSALHQVRGGISAHRHRQGAEVQDARDRHQGTGAGGRGQD